MSGTFPPGHPQSRGSHSTHHPCSGSFNSHPNRTRLTTHFSSSIPTTSPAQSRHSLEPHPPLSPSSPASPRLTVKVAGVIFGLQVGNELRLLPQQPGPVQVPEETVLLDLEGSTWGGEWGRL